MAHGYRERGYRERRPILDAMTAMREVGERLDADRRRFQQQLASDLAGLNGSALDRPAQFLEDLDAMIHRTFPDNRRKR